MPLAIKSMLSICLLAQLVQPFRSENVWAGILGQSMTCLEDSPEQSMCLLDRWAPVLPEDCNGYTVVDWPYKTKPKTIILGEKHRVCEYDRWKCTRALVNSDIFQQAYPAQNKTVILFEGEDFNSQIPCGIHGFAEISNQCWGWNRPHQDVAPQLSKFPETMTLLKVSKQINPNVNRLNNYNNKNQLNEKHILDFVKHNAHVINETITSLNGILFFNNHKDKLMRQLFDINQTTLMYLTFIPNIIKYLSEFDLQIKAHGTCEYPQRCFVEILKSYKKFVEKTRQVFNQLKKMNNMPALTSISNDHLLFSIKHHSPPEEAVIAFAGNLHVNRKLAARNKEYQPIVTTLLDQLDQEADENPYAVLSCSG